MAEKIRGITIAIDGDATGLNKALEGVDKSLKSTQSQLKDVNKLLKLDPKNTELLRQKQELLGKAVEQSKSRIESLQNVQKELGERTAENAQQYDAVEREIIATRKAQEDYEAQLSEMTPKVATFSDKMKDVSDKTAQLADKTKVLSGAAAGLGAALLGNAVKSAAAADDLATLSAQTGLSVEEIQKMQYASNLVDVSVDDMTGSLKKLTQQMGKDADVFDKLGVSITDSNGEMRSATDVWYDSLEALSKIQNETERDALSMELFGKSAASLTGIIDDGGAAMKELGQEAEDLGLVMSGDAVNAAVEFNNQMDLMKQRTSMAFMEMGSALATTLVPMLEKLVEVVTSVVTWFSDLDGTTQAVIVAVLGLVAAISPVLSLISLITGAAAALNVAVLPMIGTMALVVAGIAAVIAIGVTLYKNWDTIKEKATELWQNITTTFNNIKQTVVDAVQKIKDAFNFKWELPKISLPHFRITGGEPPYGFMGKGSFPSIDVDWYKKAYRQGILFTSPTVLGTSSGLKGFGDGNGSELVIGTDTLMGAIRGASGATELGHISELLETIASNGVNVMLVGDAAGIFKQVRRENTKFKGSTGKSAFNY